MKTAQQLASEFVALFVLDVREQPDCYKSRVRDNPEDSARSIIDGLDCADLKTMLRDLKAERRAVARR